MYYGPMTNEQNGVYYKLIGLASNDIKVGMINVVYNMKCFVSLHRIREPVI